MTDRLQLAQSFDALLQPAKFRDYGDFSAAVTPTIGMSAEGVITFTGVLQSSATINGAFTPVAGAISPYPVPRTGAGMFYRTASQ